MQTKRNEMASRKNKYNIRAKISLVLGKRDFSHWCERVCWKLCNFCALSARKHKQRSKNFEVTHRRSEHFQIHFESTFSQQLLVKVQLSVVTSFRVWRADTVRTNTRIAYFNWLRQHRRKFHGISLYNFPFSHMLSPYFQPHTFTYATKAHTRMCVYNTLTLSCMRNARKHIRPEWVICDSVFFCTCTMLLCALRPKAKSFAQHFAWAKIKTKCVTVKHSYISAYLCSGS